MSFGHYCGRNNIIFLTPRGCWKLKFLKKKGSLSSEKNFLAIFSRDIEHNKYQETIYKGPQGFLAITVEVIRSIL